MGKIIERLNNERGRTDEHQLRTIYLHREGKFFRAYDWSAWLFVQHIKPGMKTIKTHATTNLPEYVFVGFPTNTIEQYLHVEHTTILSATEDLVCIELDDARVPYEVSLETLTEAYTQWCEDIPYAEKKESVVEKNAPVSHVTPVATGLFDVVREILQFSIEQHSPLEAQTFLTEVKAKLIRIF